MRKLGRNLAGLGVVAALALSGCSSPAAGESTIEVSGSSTVAPITTAMAVQGGFPVNVAAEGTTDGFQRFCSGETDINDASEAIPGEGQPTDYLALCEDNGVEYLELPITFDYFTQAIVGEVGSIRSDYQTSDDTDELAAWIAADVDALGFMGVGNYLAADGESRDLITNVTVDGIAPTRENAQDGSYPLTRPLFIYVSKSALSQNASLQDFVAYYLDNVEGLLPRVYYYALPHEAYALTSKRFEDQVTGSMFDGDPFSTVSVLAALQES